LASLPGDGAGALEHALRQALAAGGVPIVARGGRYVVQGRVTFHYGRLGRQWMEVAWIVDDGAGRALGTVRQNGPVPPGGLPKHWGKLADAIAAGGAEGILRVIRDTARRPPAPLQGG
jgi:hypothetical protein